MTRLSHNVLFQHLSRIQEAGMALHADTQKMGRYAAGRNTSRDFLRVVKPPVDPDSS